MKTAEGSYLQYPFDEEIEQGYFAGYGKIEIHNEMRDDVVRTRAYKDAFDVGRCGQNKIFLEVGTGSGVLIFDAIRTGEAKTVHAVEASSIIHVAITQIKAAGFKGVRFYHARIEDVVLNPTDPQKVDVIYSEFMGYFLL